MKEMDVLKMNLQTSANQSNLRYSVQVFKSEAIIVWVVRDFFKHITESKSPLNGPRFQCLDATWEVLIEYSGEILNDAAGDIQFLFRRISSSVSIHRTSLNFWFHKSGEEIYGKNEGELCKENSFCGLESSVDLTDLLKDKMDDEFDKDTLIIYCKIKNPSINEEEEIEELDLPLDILKGLSRDFEKLYESSDYSDVVLKTGKQELTAHRAVLGARSNVFSDMFKQNSPSNEFEVEDVDASTLEDLLVYIYSGRIQHLSSDNVCKLYAAADKYALEDLKQFCLLYMRRNLSAKNVCDILTLCEKYDLADLSSLAEAFFHKHAAEVIESKEWAFFEVKCPDLALTLFRSFVRVCKTENEPEKEGSPPDTTRRARASSLSTDSSMFDVWWKVVVVFLIGILLYFEEWF